MNIKTLKILSNIYDNIILGHIELAHKKLASLIKEQNSKINIEVEVKVIKRHEVEINKTPTGELRNLLCDVNILLQSNLD